ncbi:MAG TPA: phosphoribosylformylglycinamidine synthase subunit PurL, partial [Pyrinomonadaceae bacterium]|nr:phosphoribosylformylglycinamidine synthase subunit PurL [Pyrinomonadaceae bacterium]
GIAHYGNAFGVPTIGGEVSFNDAYALNPLVNAFALGLVRKDQIFFGKATGVGNPVLYVGAKTGRDGIHGATMASAEFDEEALEKRPTVQVGDPFLEKLLLEACLEAMRSGAVAGIQDMGAAGLTCSTCEMAARADTGIEIDLSLVPQRETGMTAYEMLLSESQERMLIVAHKGREREVIDIFAKWDLDAVIIGQVRDDNRMRVSHNGEVVCDMPVKALTDEAPIYERPMAGSAGILPANASAARVTSFRADALNADGTSAIPADTSPQNYNEALLQLLSSPNLASKEWVYRQYDHMVRTNTVVLPGADAAVVRIKETRRALAVALDGNGRYCSIDPRAGARLIVAEAARNVVCVGAQPIAITNCLNFASPERPEVMWSFSEVIDGITEACKAFNTPVVSGNVSFYNETEGRGILPTPVIGMLGLIDDVRRIVQPGFKNPGDFIALLGTTGEDLTASEYAAVYGGSEIGVPKLNLDTELAVQLACLRAAQNGLLRSAHDCSDGGLAVALAECCFSSLNHEACGADIDITGEYDLATRLFSESPSRIIISFDQAVLGEIEEIVAAASCPMTLIGNVGSDRLRIESDGEEVIEVDIDELETAWRSSLKEKLQAEAMAAGAE